VQDRDISEGATRVPSSGDGLEQVAQRREVLDEPLGLRPDAVPDRIEPAPDDAVEIPKQSILDRELVELDLLGENA
jgi:hypothetical protein